MHPNIPPTLGRLLASPHVAQRAFSWPKNRWMSWLSEIDGGARVLNSLPDAVDRASTAETVDAYVREGAFTEAFIACMVWGHGHSGYGPYRTARILSGAPEQAGKTTDGTVIKRLQTSIERFNASGAVDAYRYLNNDGHIDGLGPAFFTKWLYFISAGSTPYGAQAAPVLDQLVIDWLRTHASVPLRYAKTLDYDRYVELLGHWGEAHGRTPVQVEEAIFRLIRNDGADQDSPLLQAD